VGSDMGCGAWLSPASSTPASGLPSPGEGRLALRRFNSTPASPPQPSEPSQQAIAKPARRIVVQHTVGSPERQPTCRAKEFAAPTPKHGTRPGRGERWSPLALLPGNAARDGALGRLRHGRAPSWSSGKSQRRSDTRAPLDRGSCADAEGRRPTVRRVASSSGPLRSVPGRTAAATSGARRSLSQGPVGPARPAPGLCRVRGRTLGTEDCRGTGAR
jgi:hypothetical protein